MWLATASVLLGANHANAAAPVGLVGTFSAEYARSDSNGSNADVWGLSGAGAFGFGDTNEIGGEINGGYHRLSIPDVDADSDIWNVGGSVFWAPAIGRFGPTVTYSSISFSGAASGLDVHATTYGVFGEFFASPFITLAAKGGGVSGKANLSGVGSGSDTGTYLGGSVTGYLMPNLALNGAIDYLDFSGIKVTAYGVNAEYLISEMTPISVFAGYNHTQISDGGGDADAWLIGLKFYTGGPAPLVTRHRTGTLGSVGTVSGLQSLF
jgi:hypothetical protein